MDVYEKIVINIIQSQETIIGPVAVERAKLVNKLQVNWSKHAVSISGDPQGAINDLVKQYQELFGQIAVETCKEAAASFTSQLTPAQLPQSLK